MPLPLDAHIAERGAEVRGTRRRWRDAEPVAQRSEVGTLALAVVGVDQHGQVGRAGRRVQRFGRTRVCFFGEGESFGVVGRERRRHQAFLAKALHQPLAETCLPANKGQAPLGSALPWYSEQSAQDWPAA